MLRVRSNTSLGPATCPLCRDALGEREGALGDREGAAYRCVGCETGYHPECVQELGGCSTLGCARRGQPPSPAHPGDGQPGSLIDWDQVESRSLEELRERTRAPAANRAHDAVVLVSLACAAGLPLIAALRYVGLLRVGETAFAAIAAVLALMLGAALGDRLARREPTPIANFATGASAFTALGGASILGVGVTVAIYAPSQLGGAMAGAGVGLLLLVLSLCLYTAAGGRHR